MIKKILVIGGTGLLGFPVAKQLQKDGFEADILTTNPGKARKKYGDAFNYIQGDVKDPDLLQKIFNEYQGIHINLNSSSYKELEKIEIDGCRNIASAVQPTEIKKITMISGLGVHPGNAHIPFIKAKLEVEKVVKDSGVPYTIFNCTHFMEGIALYIRNGKAMIIGEQPHKIHWLSAEDYARMVSRSFEIRESDFTNYPVLGPESYTMKEAFEKYVEQVDPTIKISHVSLGMLNTIAFLTFNRQLKFVVDLMKYFNSVPERFKPEELTDILGKAEISLDDWLEKQK